MNCVEYIFLRHPKEKGEGYWQHMREALWISACLLRASLAAFVHALIPALCTTTASEAAAEVMRSVQNRGPKNS